MERVIIPLRLALICRAGQTLGYNPVLNVWHRLDERCAEALRWLRAGRDRAALVHYFAKRFNCSVEQASKEIHEIIKWCILRRMLYLDRQLTTAKPLLGTNVLRSVYWICTQACNLKCMYCYQDAAMARSNELSTAEAKDLIEQARELGVESFIFTGGEPFVRRDLLDIATLAKTKGMRTSVISNGHYISRKNIHRVALVFDSVTISLDHMIPAHHDRVRGSGSWQRAIDAIDLLLDAGVQVNVNSTLSSAGLRDIQQLISLKYKKRLSAHRIVPQFPMGRAASARQDELTPAELVDLSDELYRANQEAAQSNAFLSTTQNRKGQRRVHCGAGLSEIAVDSQGWVYPCKLLQYPQHRAGNIRELRLHDIVTKDTALREARRAVVDTLHPCKTCIIKNHCGGGCRGIHFSFTREYAQSSPLFCAHLRRTFEVQAWASTGDVPPPRTTQFNDTTVSDSQLIPISSLTANQ
ncbi:MAG TPA: radical SAM protein [Terriglobales bacterium]|nr:radical SAM protein [Terriglobales bacterium]